MQVTEEMMFDVFQGFGNMTGAYLKTDTTSMTGRQRG